MNKINSIKHRIIIGAEDNDEAEELFFQKIRAFTSPGDPLKIVGVEGRLSALERLSRARGIFAFVELDDLEGRTWCVGLDAVHFEPGSPASLITTAYRAWLGYPTSSDEEARAEVIEEIAPVGDLDERGREIRERLKRAKETLEGFDLEEVTSWVGDDDPWGAHREHWPDDAEEYVELLQDLNDIPKKLKELASGGSDQLASELIFELMKTLEAAKDDYSCPDEVSCVASDAIEAWIEFIPLNEARLHQVSDWVEDFELEWSLGRLLERAPPEAASLLDDWLEWALSIGKTKISEQLSDHLCERSLRASDIDTLLQRVPIGCIATRHALSIIKGLEAREASKKALGFIDVWLSTHPSSFDKGEVEVAQRRLMSEAGHPDQAKAFLWKSFDARPMGGLLDEILQGGDQQLIEKASARIAKVGVSDLFQIGASSRPHEMIAAHILSMDVESMSRSVSSWTLEKIADRYLTEDGTFDRVAAALYAALGWRHVNRGKAKYYSHSLKAFGQAKALYLKLDEQARWLEIFKKVEAIHGRKYSFMPSFKRLNA